MTDRRHVSLNDMHAQPNPKSMTEANPVELNMRLWMFVEMRTHQFQYLAPSTEIMRWWKDMTQ